MAAVIPEEFVPRVPGQDSAAHEEQPDLQEDVPTTPDPLHVLDEDSAEDDSLPTLNQDTLQEILYSIWTPSPVAQSGDSIGGSPEDSPITQQTPPASLPPVLDSEEPQVEFQRHA